MPSMNNQPHVPQQDPQGSQDNLFVDADDREFPQHLGDVSPPIDEFKSLFKKKSANVKRRITMTINYLAPLERDNVPIHDDDITSVRKHLSHIDSALEVLNQTIEDATDIDQEALDPFIKIADDYVPQVTDIRARINAVQCKLAPLMDASQPNLQSQKIINSNKIDHTFRPEPLDKDATPAIFEQWKEQFQVYASTNNFHKAPIQNQRILLGKCLTPAMHANLKRVCAATTAKSLDDLLDEVEKYILRSNNLLMRRYQYFKCVQVPGESYEEYIARFRDIGDFAQFDSFSYDANMACRLITGIIDEDLRSQLLRLPKTDFQTLHDFTLAWAASKSNASMVTADNGIASPQEVNKVSAYKSNKKSSFHKNATPTSHNRHTSQARTKSSAPQNAPSNKQHLSSDKPCYRCGYSQHPTGVCPAADQECSFCKIVGHFKQVCKKYRRRSNHINHVQEQNQDNQPHPGSEPPQDDDFGQGHVNIVDCAVFQVNYKPTPTPRIPALFAFSQEETRSGQVLPDTGAAVSVFPSNLLQSWGWDKYVQPSSPLLKSASGDDIPCHGTICIRISVYDASAEVAFYVCPDVKCVLLSWVALKDLGVVSKRFPVPPHISQVSHCHSEIDQYKQFIISSFPRVFSQTDTLAPMTGNPMIIHLRNNIDWSNIKCTFKPRPIPIPLQEAARAEIESMIQKEIIMPVSEPTPFVSPMLVIPKKQNSVRLVVDYTELNKYVRRPIHPFPSVQEVKASIPSTSKYFATMDALQGYWQVPLHKSSQSLTTFLTPWGRYCFRRAPMGLSASGDEYCRRGDVAFQGIQNVIKVVDDVLVHAPTLESLKSTIYEVMQAAQANGISLSPNKFSIGQSVSFVGLNITSEGIRPDPKHLRALSDFPRPKNKTDLRSFFGLLNQFASFSKDITPQSKALRPLLSNQSEWHWNEEHERAFVTLRGLLTSSPILRYFSPHLETKLLTDASRLNGIGYALLQKHHDGWALVSCGSRTITSTEGNYAVCELEALAIVWAIQKSRIYLMGLPTFTVVTDHRPLVTIFNSSRLVRNDNPRLVRLMQKVVMYSFKVHWVPGKVHKIPDALSRAPLRVCAISSQGEDEAISEPVVLTEDPALAKLSAEAKACNGYNDLYHAVSSMTSYDVGKLPSKTHGHIRAFLSIWDRLSCDPQSGLVLLDSTRIVVPQSARKRILSLVHASHQGITRTKARLQSIYFWHGMCNDVVQKLQTCELCLKFKSSQSSLPYKDPDVPAFPFQKVSCDLFDYQGSFTIVYVDRFTGWPLVAHFPKSPSSSQIIKVLSSFFRDFGVPQAIRHDGARPLVSQEFSTFLKEHHVQDELSAAYHPQSNGHAEAAVKAIKLLVKKCWLTRQIDLLKFNNALLEWRNTPRMPGARSPAELLFKRKLRTLLPTVNYDSISDHDVVSAVHKNYEALRKSYHSINCRKRDLPPLVEGDAVIIRDTTKSIWARKGTILSKRNHGSSYFVKSEGKTLLRNRKHLKKILQ